MSLLVRSLINPVRRTFIFKNNASIRYQTSNVSPVSNTRQTLKNNLLVYEYKDRVMPFLAGVGLLQFCGFNFLAYWSYYLFGTVTAHPDRLTTDSTLIDRAATIVPTNRFRYATAGSIVVISTAILLVSFIYPARCIRRLYLLKDSSTVGIVTYAAWPNARKFTVPLEKVASDTALHGVGIFHKLRLKDRKFSFLVNRREGTFHNKMVYEGTIAVKRF